MEIKIKEQSIPQAISACGVSLLSHRSSPLLTRALLTSEGPSYQAMKYI